MLAKPPIDRRQADGWSCGPVAAAVALDLLGRPAAEADAVRRAVAATPLDGTDPRTLEAALRRAGCRVLAGEMDHADLVHHAARGRPVLCLVTVDLVGHWVAVYAATRRLVRYHCPIRGACGETAAAFRAGWRDTDRAGVEHRQFGLAVLPG